MNHFLLALEISGITVAALIIMAVLLASVRAAIGQISTKWNASDVGAAEKRASTEWWPHRSLSAFDIAFNVIILRGQPDETISTHSYRASLEGKLWGKAMILWLDGIQPNHGPRAASGDLERAQSRVAVLSKILGV